MSPYTAKHLPDTQDQNVVRIYIDNSNLWLQGQKTFAEKTRQTVAFDPRWRFDVGRLRDILIENTKLQNADVKINLYGSEPPPVDTIWKALKSHDIAVKTFRRSTFTNREKEVDNSLSLDAAVRAVDDAYTGVQSEFVIVSGDRDLFSAVAKIIERNITVHVWSWKNAMAKIYMQNSENLIQVHYLDDYLEEIGYCESIFRIDRDAISPHSIVVLDPVPSAEIKRLISTLSIPVWLYEDVGNRAGAVSLDLVIIPTFAAKMKHDEHVRFLQEVKTKFRIHGLSVMTYFEYSQKFHRDSSDDALQISERFKELALENTDNYEDGNEEKAMNEDVHTENSDDAGFREVNYRTEKRRNNLKKNRLKSGTRCIWGKYCDDGSYCKRRHTEDEQKFFEKNGPKKRTKYKLCLNNPCPRAKQCWFAHGLEELLCPTCDRIGAGHSMENCPSAQDQRRRW